METKIIVDMLTENSVSISRQNYTTIDGMEYKIGDNIRTSYVNSPTRRSALIDDVPEPYLSAILAVWGENPTIEDVSPSEKPIEPPTQSE